MTKFPEWGDLRYFLELARTGTLSAAAQRMGVEHTTVARRLTRLEEQLGTALFDRRRDGYSLTEAGQALVPHAEAMESALLDAIAETGAKVSEAAGTVRIGTTEGFAICVLAPRLAKLYAKHPNLQIELMALPRFPSLASREVEILVTLNPPRSGHYIVARFLDLNYHLYASPAYLASHKPITELKDLAGHDFVDYVQDYLMSEDLRYLNELTPQPLRRFTSTSILAQREAIAAGLGLALMAPYVVMGRNDVVRVFHGKAPVTRTLWITTPSSLFRLRRIRVVWNYLREIAEMEPGLFDFLDTK
ncbi:MAG: LysR family transcriptional regulator [Proteobacteria bacterium]|nr:LysR family transcriptional regulator [Pseudomonadota bacterium]